MKIQYKNHIVFIVAVFFCMKQFCDYFQIKLGCINLNEVHRFIDEIILCDG